MARIVDEQEFRDSAACVLQILWVIFIHHCSNPSISVLCLLTFEISENKFLPCLREQSNNKFLSLNLDTLSLKLLVTVKEAHCLLNDVYCQPDMF